MSKISQKQQNVPIRPRNNEEVQTDVNLIASRRTEEIETRVVGRDSHFFDFVSESWMLPFSDFYLLNQLNSVISQLRNHQAIGDQFKTRRIIAQLSSKIHGLLARELKVTSTNNGYYEILMDKEKQLIKMDVKYGSYEKKIDQYMQRIQQLERQIVNLRGSLKIYQIAAQQNQLYKGLFRELKDLTVSSRKQTDFERTLNQQILPKIRQFEVSLAEISKNTARERASKQKAAISKYALELDALSKVKDLNWQALSDSVANFYSGLQNLNGDDWISQRINLSQSYIQLRQKHTAVLSLVQKNIRSLLQKDLAFKNFNQVITLIQELQRQNQDGFETVIVNGWIGLGVIHCHNHQQGANVQQIKKLQALIVLFQRQMAKLIDRYPQLNQSLTIELRQFLKIQISAQFLAGDALGWIKQIVVKQVEVVHVDNVYHYFNKNDKTNVYHLKVLLKALLEELKRITGDHKISIQLDQGILQLLRAQVLDGINIQDIIALFRPSARVCEVNVLVDRPVYLPITETIGVPLREEKAVIVSDTTHFAVNLQQGVAYRKQIPYEYCKSEVVQVPVTVQKPYGVPTIVSQQVIRQVQKVSVVKVPVVQDKYIQVIRQVPVNLTQQVIAVEQQYKQFKVPYSISQTQTRQIQVQKQVPKNVYRQINKIFKVQQTVPKVYKQPKFQIVEKIVPHVIIQKQIQFIQVQKPIIQRSEIAKVCEVVVEKPIYHVDHCDCQKPQAVVVQVQKPIYKQYPKQIIVEKCHYVQPNVQERIVQVACHTQVPIYKQIIKQQPVIIQKPIPFRTIEQKLVVVDRQIPFFIEHFTPVQLIVQKPVIVRDIKHVPVAVEHPVPVYIEKLVPKIVQVIRQKIVEKIVEVPRIEIIERIVQKIVPVPRIVEKLVPVTQIVQVPVFIPTPQLQIVHIEVEKIVHDIREIQKIVQVRHQVLKIENNLQVVDKIQYQQVRKVIEVQPQNFPEIIVQKIVRVVQEVPVEVYIDRIVDRVIHIKDIVPVEQRVQIPIEVQCPVEIISQKPVFYKQPVVQIDVQRVEREKLIELEKQIIQIRQVPTPYIQKQKQVVEIPGQTIILKEPQLHIIQIQKESIVTAIDIEQKPIEQYMDIQKAYVIDQQTFVTPEKQVCYLQKPYPVYLEKTVGLKNQQMIVVERPDTLVVRTREGRNQQVVKIISQQKLAVQKESYPEPIRVPEHHYHLLYEELPPKLVDRSVLAVDEKVKAHQVNTRTQVFGAFRQTTKLIQVPVHMQKIFEKILMLPQIVEVEKKIYMVEQINTLIAKEVDVEVHYNEYKTHMLVVQDSINQILAMINSGRQPNTGQFKKKLSLFLELLRTESRIPKIVQNIREVQVIKEKDRPVLVPVYDSQREKVLCLIISDLLDGIKGISKQQIQKRFSLRIRNLFAVEFGIQKLLQFATQLEVDKSQVQRKWKSWFDNYGKNLPDTRPEQPLSEAELQFFNGYDSKDINFATIKSAIQRSVLINKQRLTEIEKLKAQYFGVVADLRAKIQSLEAQLSNEKYYKDFYFNSLLKIKRTLELIIQQQDFGRIQSVLQTIRTIEVEVVIKSTVSVTYQRRITSEQVESRISQQSQQKVSDLISQITLYENQTHLRNREIQNLRQENERLRYEIDEVKLNIPVWNKQSKDDNLRKYNEEWEERIKALEQNHFLQLNHLREQLIKRITDTSGTAGTNELGRSYEQLMKKYTSLSESQATSQNTRRNLINSYEEKIRDANKQLLVLRRDYEALQKKSQTDRNRLIDEYEKRISSTSSNQERQLRRQIDNLKRNYQSLQQRSQAEKRRLIDEYEKKATSTASNQERQLRRQLDLAVKNLQSAEQKFQAEKKKIVDEYESKSKLSSGTQQRQFKKQIDTLKRKGQADEQRFQAEKQRFEADKKKITEDYERKMKQLQDDLDRLRTSRRGTVSSPTQNQQVQILKQRIAKLEKELDSSKKEVENYQKSRLGQTTYTSGIKQSVLQSQFQSPQGASRYKSSGPKFEEVIQGSGLSKQQQPEQGRISKSGVRGQRKSRLEQAEERSSSSRVSGGSESSNFKSSMTMRQFMSITKAEDKDAVMTLVMIKIIQKIQQEADKGIINSYSPNNIYLSNFNPNNLQALIVRFGAPITNRKSKTDGLYLSPEVLRGEPTSLKSVVFTLAVIWDELIHYEIYYRSVADIQNLSLEYKVRDTSLNPILRNTLFEMMSKDPAKRLDLGEAKRRLSLQRYIVGQGRAGTQSRRP